jgi:hypothetical protein
MNHIPVFLIDFELVGRLDGLRWIMQVIMTPWHQLWNVNWYDTTSVSIVLRGASGVLAID